MNFMDYAFRVVFCVALSAAHFRLSNSDSANSTDYGFASFLAVVSVAWIALWAVGKLSRKAQ